jgi:hypothetical protein
MCDADHNVAKNEFAPAGIENRMIFCFIVRGTGRGTVVAAERIWQIKYICYAL